MKISKVGPKFQNNHEWNGFGINIKGAQILNDYTFKPIPGEYIITMNVKLWHKIITLDIHIRK